MMRYTMTVMRYTMTMMRYAMTMITAYVYDYDDRSYVVLAKNFSLTASRHWHQSMAPPWGSNRS